MGFFKWLYRLPGRIERSMERTVVDEARGGTEVSLNTALSKIEAGGSREEDSTDGERS